MQKFYGLSYTEAEMMEFFWSQTEGVSFKEILEYANSVLNKDWKKQTLSTYLKNLQLSGLIKADESKRNYMYYVNCTKEEHIHHWTKTLVEKSFGNSIGKFMEAFTGGKALDEKEAEELRKLL